MSVPVVRNPYCGMPAPSAVWGGSGVRPRVGGRGVGAERAEATTKKWRSLSRWWAVYYCVVFTVGRFEEYTRATIWVGGLVVGLLTLRLLIRRVREVPSEAWLLVSLAGWSLLSGLGAEDSEAYWSYLTLLLECVFVVGLLGAVVRRTGDMNSMWWAFLVVAVFNTWYVWRTGVVVTIRDFEGLDRQAGLTGNPNGLGFYCFIGVMGAMAILGETKSLLRKSLCIAGAVVAFGGMVVAGSRGAYLAWILAVVLWATTCLGGAGKRWWKLGLGAVVAGAILYPTAMWIQESTTLGQRSSGAINREDTSSEERLELGLIALEITLRHPFTGVGLGQFGRVSETGGYAHNEWAEVAATTGIPGFLLLLGFYFSIGSRLWRPIAGRWMPVEWYRVRMARVALIVLVVSGAVFRPNILSVETMFLVAVVVGAGNWSLRR